MTLLEDLKGINDYLDSQNGLKNVEMVVLYDKRPSNDGPNPPCEVEGYSLYIVAKGEKTTVARMSHRIADVWLMKDFGELRLVEAANDDKEIEILGLLYNEVVSAGYRPVDPFAETKLNATIAEYMKQVLNNNQYAKTTLHIVKDGVTISEEVTEESAQRKAQEAKTLLFRPLMTCTESIPLYLDFYETRDSPVQ